MINKISVYKTAPWTGIAIAAVFAIGATYLSIATSPVVIFIVGLPGIIAYIIWRRTFYVKDVAPARIVPVYLATAAGFLLHVIEEYLGGYSLAISRIFGFPWTERAFFITVILLSAMLFLSTIGLLLKKSVAGFIALLFVLTRFAELALFVFPFVRPVVAPFNAGSVSATLGKTVVADMPNYYVAATHSYYFPGMFTVILPLVPAIFLMVRLFEKRK